MLCLSLADLFHAHNDVKDEIANTSGGDKGRDYELRLFESAVGSPNFTEGLFLVAAGLVGLTIGFFVFLVCFYSDGRRRDTMLVIGLIVLSVVVFHVGLCCLLG